MVYKIGFIGTHSAGKTALAGLVEGELKRRDVEIKRLGETATDARERGLPINEETTLESQLWILHSWCSEDILYSTHRIGRPKYDVLLSDRGPENYCYLENKSGENAYALSIVLGHLKLFPYDKLYRLPLVSDQIVDNDLRTIDPSFQKIMDEKIVLFLDKHHIPYIALPIPEDHDHLRDVWTRMVVNDTLRALQKQERDLMR